MKNFTLVSLFVLLGTMLTPINSSAGPVRSDLTLTMKDSADPARAYSPLTYTTTVKNVGLAKADSVILTDQLPASTNFGSISTSKGSCTVGRGISCSIGTLAVNEAAQVSLVVTPLTSGRITITNTATATSTGKDANDADNTVSESTTVVYGAIADLAVTAKGEPGTVPQNGFAGFVITAHNLGPEASPAYVGITLTPGLQHVASGPMCSHIDGTVNCNAGGASSKMLMGQSSGINLVVRAIGSGPQSVSVEIGGSGWDPDPANNSTSVTIHVEGSSLPLAVPGDPAAELSLSTDLYRHSYDGSIYDDTIFSMRVMNYGSISAEDVTLSISLYPDPDATPVTNVLYPDQASCTYSDGKVFCQLGDIPPSSSAYVDVRVRTPELEPAGNAASVETVTPERTLSNNHSASLALPSYQNVEEDNLIPDMVDQFLHFVCWATNPWVWCS